jgi:hypothetical protein
MITGRILIGEKERMDEGDTRYGSLQNRGRGIFFVVVVGAIKIQNSKFENSWLSRKAHDLSNNNLGS